MNGKHLIIAAVIAAASASAERGMMIENISDGKCMFSESDYTIDEKTGVKVCPSGNHKKLGMTFELLQFNGENLIITNQIVVNQTTNIFIMDAPTDWIHLSPEGEMNWISNVVQLEIKTSISTNRKPVSVTIPIDDFGTIVAPYRNFNYQTNYVTNRTASFCFEGKEYKVELK